MKRGLVATIVLIEVLVAAGFALAFGFSVVLGLGFAQRSGNLHGGVAPATAQEQAQLHAAGVGGFAVTFAIVLVAELALTAGVLFIIRRGKRLEATPRRDNQRG